MTTSADTLAPPPPRNSSPGSEEMTDKEFAPQRERERSNRSFLRNRKRAGTEERAQTFVQFRH